MTVSVSVDRYGILFRIQEVARAKVRRAILAVMEASNEAIIAATPVWSAETISNYRWGVGLPDLTWTPFGRDHHWGWYKRNPPDTAAALSIQNANYLRAVAQVNAVRDPTRTEVFLRNNIIYDNGETIEDLENGVIGKGGPYKMFARAELAGRIAYERIAGE